MNNNWILGNNGVVQFAFTGFYDHTIIPDFSSAVSGPNGRAPVPLRDLIMRREMAASKREATGAPLAGSDGGPRSLYHRASSGCLWLSLEHVVGTFLFRSTLSRKKYLKIASAKALLPRNARF